MGARSSSQTMILVPAMCLLGGVIMILASQNTVSLAFCRCFCPKVPPHQHQHTHAHTHTQQNVYTRILCP